MENTKKLIDKIKTLFEWELEKPGMTEARLAESLDINQGTVAKYLKGRTKQPDIETLSKIRRHFKKSWEFFLEENVGQTEEADPIRSRLLELYEKFLPYNRDRLLEDAEGRWLMQQKGLGVGNKEGIYLKWGNQKDHDKPKVSIVNSKQRGKKDGG